MVLIGVRVDQDVVDIHDDPAIQHVSKQIINECLENRRTIDQPERHYKIFIVPRGSGESRFPLIALSDANEIVCTAKIKFSKVLGRSKLFQGRWD